MVSEPLELPSSSTQYIYIFFRRKKVSLTEVNRSIELIEEYVEIIDDNNISTTTTNKQSLQHKLEEEIKEYFSLIITQWEYKRAATK